MERRFRWAGAVLAAAALWGCGGSDDSASPPAPESPGYPATQATATTDTYFGQSVQDPYRWLEATRSTPVIDWVRAQNAFSTAQVESQPLYAAVLARVTELRQPALIDHAPDVAHAARARRFSVNGLAVDAKQVGKLSGGKFYYQWQQRLDSPTRRHQVPAATALASAHSVDNKIYVAEKRGQEGKLLLDVAQAVTREPDDHLELSAHQVTEDGQHLFFLLKRNYADLSELHHVNLASSGPSQVLSHRVSSSFHLEDASVIWVNVEDVTDPASSAYSRQAIRRWVIGTPPADTNVLYDGVNGKLLYTLGVQRDQLYFGVNGKQFETLYSLNLDTPADLTPLMQGDGVNVFDPWDMPDDQGRLLVMTSEGIAHRRMVAVDLHRPEPANWQHILPSAESDVVDAENVTSCGEDFYALQWTQGAHALVRYQPNGSAAPIALPGQGFVQQLSCDEDQFSYVYSTLAQPPTVFAYDASTDTSRPLRSYQYADYDPAQFEVKYLQAIGKDKTPVPLTLVHRKGFVPNGQATAMIYVYGGFDVPIPANFGVARTALPLTENGGVFVVAHVRGGSENGTAWHDDGRLLNKQHTYDDVAAVARHLIDEGYTSAARLGVTGASNGGTTSAAVALQFPDLFAAAIPQVGVHDLVRFPLFTQGYGWLDDYGDPTVEDEFLNLMKFSPLHHVKAQRYPAIYVMSGENDQRVQPSHSYKLAATLQNVATGPGPYLLHSYAKSGHGMEGESTRANAHQLTFLFAQTATSYKGIAPRAP